MILAQKQAEIVRTLFVIISHFHQHLQGALAVKMFEQIAFVRLIPKNFIGGDRPDVETIDIRR